MIRREWKDECPDHKTCRTCLYDGTYDRCRSCRIGDKWTFGGHYFCSLCGKPLTEKAWDWLEEVIQDSMCSNPPLTLDELREMDMEPVWVCNPQNIQEGHWAIVREDKSDGPQYNHGVYAVGLFWRFSDYGKTWMAYQRKPEDRN